MLCCPGNKCRSTERLSHRGTYRCSYLPEKDSIEGYAAPNCPAALSDIPSALSRSRAKHG